MSDTINYKDIMSPCIDQCRNDSNNEFCISCFRTVQEKKTWWKFTKEEKKKIISELPIRLKTW